MNKDLKLIIAFIITILMATLFYFGSFSPFQKFYLYIKAANSASQIHSVQKFNELFNKALDFYSPVGHNEVVSSYLDVLMKVIQNSKNKQVAEILLQEADRRTKPILEADKGSNFFQILQIYAMLYELAGQKFNNAAYYQKASDVYEIALRHSPGRINLLYSLFRTSFFLNNKEKIRQTGEAILKQQPDNEEIKKYLRQVN